jgi:hypothetical protein
MADTYVDTSLATNGDGTEATPYNNFTTISDGGANELTGDLAGAVIYIKGGTDTRELLKLNTASNFEIKAYGVGDNPLIRGSDIVTASWTLDSSNGFYYLSSAAVHALFVDGEQVIDVATVGELTGTTQWFDSGNSRIYISFNPTGNQFEITERDKCIWLVSCSSYTVRDVVLEKADESNLVSDGSSAGAKIYDIETRYAGGWNLSGRDGILMVGNSITPDTGVEIKNVNAHDNQNCGAELHYLNGAVLNENRLTDNGNGFELWQGVSNSTFRRNIITGSTQRGTSNGHGNGFWVSSDAGASAGGNPSNTFAYNIILNTYSPGIAIDDGTGQLIYNNTIYGCGAVGSTGRGITFIQQGTNAVGATVKNNIVVLTETTPMAVQIGSAIDEAATVANMVMQDNQYYHATITNRPNYQIGSDSASYSNADPAVALAAFKAALTTPDTTSDYGDPTFVDTTDFELDTGSPCINTGSDVSEKVDYRKYPVYGLPDKGAKEKKIMNDVVVGSALA